MDHPKVSIIVLNWNQWKDAIECLESLYQITYPNYDVVVVDNGSKDGSVEKIKEWAEGKLIKFIEYSEEQVKGGKEDKILNSSSFNKRLTIIKNRQNYGFCVGNNIGMRHGLERGAYYVVLLNNDTVVDPQFLSQLVRVAESDGRIGMVGTKLLFYDSRTVINSVGTIILRDGSAVHLGGKDVDKGQYESLKQIFAPCAAAALYRGKMLEDVGFFDEDFFAYLEDVDIGWRARLRGWHAALSSKAVVYHKYSLTNIKYSEFKLFFLERNRVWILVKNYPLKYVIFSPFYTFYRYLKMMVTIRDKDTEVSKYTENMSYRRLANILLKAWLEAFSKLPKFLKKRATIQSTKRVSSAQVDRWFEDFSKPFGEIVRR